MVTYSTENVVVVILSYTHKLTIIYCSSHHSSVILLLLGRLDAKAETEREINTSVDYYDYTIDLC